MVAPCAAVRMDATPLILVSNDDGVHSAGIAALAEALGDLGQVVVVAPDRERSAVSHSLTLHRPLRVEEIGPGRSEISARWWWWRRTASGAPSATRSRSTVLCA